MDKYSTGFACVPLQKQKPLVVSAEDKQEAWEKGVREFVIRQEQFPSNLYDSASIMLSTEYIVTRKNSNRNKCKHYERR